MQNLIVLLIVIVCAWFTLRMLFRTLTGKGNNCGMCDACGPKDECKSKGEGKAGCGKGEGQ